MSKNEQMRKAWLNACRRKDKVNPDTALVCSQHFKEADFERDLQSELMHGQKRRKLRTGAVPSLLLLPQAETPKVTNRQHRAEKRDRKSLLQDMLDSAKDVKDVSGTFN